METIFEESDFARLKASFAVASTLYISTLGGVDFLAGAQATKKLVAIKKGKNLMDFIQ